MHWQRGANDICVYTPVRTNGSLGWEMRDFWRVGDIFGHWDLEVPQLITKIHSLKNNGTLFFFFLLFNFISLEHTGTIIKKV